MAKHASSIFLIALFFGIVWVVQTYFQSPKLFPFAPLNQKPGEFDFGAVSNDIESHYIESAKQDLLDSRKSFVEANLSDMTLSVYKEGTIILTVPIKSKGRDGSWWETPTGVYTFKTKEENHFSSLGHVYMPWSMAFQGNFFVHGWPYYPGGIPVETTYSGGCIRLTSEDAQKVYELVGVGDPIVVSNQALYADDTDYVLANSTVTAEGYLVGDLKNNFIFSNKEKDTLFPVLSITKLLTAVVSAEYANIETSLMAPGTIESISTPIPRLKAGVSYSIYDLLFPLLQESSNQSAVLIATYPSTKTFIARMDEKAKAIGMRDAKFVDPGGVSLENVATPTDLFRLSQYLYSNRQFILKMTAGTAETKIYGEPQFKNLENYNLFTDDETFVGGIVGKSLGQGLNSGLFIFELPFGNTKRPVAIVLLDSEDLSSDAKALIRQAREFYSLNALKIAEKKE